MATPSFAKEKDVYITKNDIQTFYSVYHKLNKIESLIGYANFNIVSFDETIKIAKNYSKIGKFTKKEIDFIEYIFYTPAKKFGFLGEKTVSKLTNTISKKDIIKIPATGHYLFRGEPYLIYTKMKKDVANIYLTSGIRNVPKQLKLFLRKIDKSNLNISKASFSIAPPAYSYHSISDFDVGKVGWGWKNFTASFAQTTEFSKIRHLNYVGIRYRLYNQYGVRFEPWHIKVI
jgi:hypothetical protein